MMKFALTKWKLTTTNIIAEAAVKAAKVALEAHRKAAATAATTAYVMVDIKSCDSRRGAYAQNPV
jgi:hypothetical protein